MKIGVSLPIRELGNDLEAIKEFAQTSEELGFTHLRVPDQIIREGTGALHEPITLLAYVAAITKTIELVPSVIVLPARQTVLVAKQMATLDILSQGRIRLGVGVGKDRNEYECLNSDFQRRGKRCDEQIQLLRLLWTKENVTFNGTWDKVTGMGLDPRPVQRPIPIWIGASGIPNQVVCQRIANLSDGWFVLCPPEEFNVVREEINAIAEKEGRDSSKIGTEAGVAVVGPRETEWFDRIERWRLEGLSHLCIRTLGGGLNSLQHVARLRVVAEELTEQNSEVSRGIK